MNIQNKTLFMLATAAMAAANISAQNVVDAVRYGQSSISGTARYRSMAGAFGALGGDPTVMNDNPAGLAIYRGTNVVTLTPHMAFTGTESKGSEAASSSDSNFGVSNLAALFSFHNPTSDHLVNFNVGIGLNRQYENQSKLRTVVDAPSQGSFGNYLVNQANHYLNGQLSPSSAFDWDNNYTTAPYMSMMAYDIYAFVDDPNNKHAVMDPMQGYVPYQRLYKREKTRSDLYNIAAALNVDDIFYAGVTLNIADYSSVITSEFDEDYSHDYDGSYISYDNKFETKGSGVGVNLGVMWSPLDNWRLGAAVHTPLWLTVTESYEGAMITDDDRVTDWSSFYDGWKYEFSTPWEYQVSTAFILGNRGLLSLEYDLRDFTSMRYRTNSQYPLPDDYFHNVNAAIKDYTLLQHTMKVGAEMRLTQQLSLRAGYAYVTSPYKESARGGSISSGDADLDHYDEDVTSLSDLQDYVYNSTTKPDYQTLRNQYYVTCGLGWSARQWYVDAAYMYHHSRLCVSSYPNSYSTCTPVEVGMSKSDIDITLGYRF